MSMKNKSCELNINSHRTTQNNATILYWNNSTNCQHTTNKRIICHWLEDSNCMSPAKKPGLDLKMKNNRPVSNLCFLSKLVERCMLRQLISHCSTNSLIPDFQLAYREDYNTETSLIKMCNDILWSMGKQQITLMVILDLSATFNTVYHDILLNILQSHYGITDKALQWFNNYLWPWQVKANIGNNYTKKNPATAL